MGFMTKLAALALVGVDTSTALGYDTPAVLSAFAASKLGQTLGMAAAALAALAAFIGLVILYIASGYKKLI